MAILKPTNISPSSTKDATLDILFSWQNMGDRQYSFQIQVYNNETSALVYNTTKLSNLNAFHVVPFSTLSNGIQFKFTITVWNQVGASATSDWITFKTSSTPVCQFTNITSSDEILNSSYLFQGSYTQLESIPIKSWNMILYDVNDYIIGTTGVQYTDIIEYQFEGLNTDSDYSIELQVRSQDDLINTTGKIPFHVRYEVPSGSIALEGENIQELAAVRLQWRVIQVIGQIVSGSIQFTDNDKIDLTNGIIAFQDGMPNFNQFNLKLWIDWIALKNEITTYQVNTCIGVVNWDVKDASTEIIRLKTPLGDIWVEWIYDDDISGRFHIYKNFYNSLYHIQSNLIYPYVGSMVYFGLDYNGNLADVYTQIL